MEEKKEIVPEEKAPIQSLSLTEKLGESVEILKAKIAALQEKNKLLMAKCKDQAIKIKNQSFELANRAQNSKPAIAGKSIYGKIKSYFSNVKVLPKKQILAFELGNEIGYLYGYILENKRLGYLVVRDAELVEYELGSNEYKVIRFAGNPYMPRENVKYICDVE